MGVSLCGIVIAFILNFYCKNHIYTTNLSNANQVVLNLVPLEFFYTIDIKTPINAFNHLLCANLASIEITNLSLDFHSDSTKIYNIHSNACELFFDSQNDILKELSNNENFMEFKINFYPVIKLLALFAMLLFCLKNITNKNLFNAKDDYVIAIILAMMAVILALGKISIGHNFGGDFALYISQAMSIVNNTSKELIANNTIMMDKTDLLYGPYAYPWGFPLILSVIYRIFGFDLWAFKCVGIVCYGIFVSLFYIFCVKRFPRIYAIFAGLLFALNPLLITYSADNIGSDIPFLLFSFAAVMVLGTLFCENLCHNKLFLAIFGGLLMAFAALIRTNGIVIVIALLITHCIVLVSYFKIHSINIRLKYHILPYIIFIIVQFIAFALFPKEKSSIALSHTKDNLNVMLFLEHIKYYTNEMATFFTQAQYSSIGVNILAICAFIAILGIIKSKTMEHIFYVLCAFGYMILLLLYPYTQGVRYAFSILPLMAYLSMKGLVGVYAWIKYIFGLLFSLILVYFIYQNIAFTYHTTGNGIAYNKYIDARAYNDYSMEAWDFIRQNTPKDAVILFFKPRVLYLQTQRLSFASANVSRLKEADFMLWYKTEQNTPSIHTSDFAKQTQLLFENRDFKFYKILK